MVENATATPKTRAQIAHCRESPPGGRRRPSASPASRFVKHHPSHPHPQLTTATHDYHMSHTYTHWNKRDKYSLVGGRRSDELSTCAPVRERGQTTQCTTATVDFTVHTPTAASARASTKKRTTSVSDETSRAARCLSLLRGLRGMSSIGNRPVRFLRRRLLLYVVRLLLYRIPPQLFVRLVDVFLRNARVLVNAK